MNWNKIPLSHKIATIIAGIAAIFWMIPKIKPDLLPIDSTYPAIAVFTLCEAVVYWNQKRKWAYLLIAAAVISIAFCALEFFLM